MPPRIRRSDSRLAPPMPWTASRGQRPAHPTQSDQSPDSACGDPGRCRGFRRHPAVSRPSTTTSLEGSWTWSSAIQGSRCGSRRSTGPEESKERSASEIDRQPVMDSANRQHSRMRVAQPMCLAACRQRPELPQRHPFWWREKQRVRFGWSESVKQWTSPTAGAPGNRAVSPFVLVSQSNSPESPSSEMSVVRVGSKRSGVTD